MDETSIGRAQVGKRGYVLGRTADSGPVGYERFRTHQTRGNVTMVALIAADSDVQVHCKQLLLTRDSKLDAETIRALRALEPPMEWLPGTSGWTNGENFCKVLTSLRRPFSVNFPGRPIILFLDAASQHADKRVLAHANRMRMQLVLVPAALTWLLQPLDTHVFRELKRRMTMVQQQIRSTSADGRLAPTAWIDILQQAVKGVIQSRDWRHAFSGNGLLGCDAGLRRAVVDGLGCFMPLTSRPPTEDELNAVVGRKRIAIRTLLLSEAIRVRREAEALEVAAREGMVAPVAESAAGPTGSGAAFSAGGASSSGVPPLARADSLRLPAARRLGFRPP